SLTISENEWYNKNEVVNSVMGDKSGILWLGTNSGLYKIDRKKYQFKKYAANHVSARLTDNYVRSLFIDKQDNLWVGFRGSAVNKLHFDYSTKKYDLTTYPALMSDGIRTYGYIINVIHCLRNGAMLFGGSTGLYLLDKKNACLIPYLPRHIPNTVLEIWTLYEDRKGNLWLGTRLGGLYILKASTKKLYQYIPIKGDDSALNDNCVWTIVEDSRGTIWLGTNDGLSEVLNPEAVEHLKFRKFPFKDKQAEHVWNIVEDEQGKLFVGTTGEGLFEIAADRRSGKRHERFPVNIIASMGFDSIGNLWVGSIDGLYKYNPVTGNTVFFSEDDGLAANDFNFKALIKTSKGEFLFGSKMGIIGFHPDKVVPKDVRSAPVRITSLRIAGADSSAALYGRSLLQLTRQQNFINIGFAVLDFTKPLRHKYRYRLEGFDDKWNYRDNSQPWATYTNLSPGNYRFIVEGSGDGLAWNDRPAVLGFYIQPAIWQRPLVQFLAVLVLLSGIGWAVYYKTRSVVRKERERNKIEKQIAELELKALQAQMNPHFIFNALNSIQKFVVHSNELAANDYLTRFARLMRFFLESSKNRYVTLEAELEQLDLYLSLEKLRFDDKFEYELRVDPEIMKGEILIPSMLVQPFAENAINHGLVHKTLKGKLTIHFTQPIASLLKCTIDDDGVGRETAKKIQARRNKGHISRGMQLIEERVKTYNFIEDKEIQILITDKQLPLTGTKVEIIIPVTFTGKT
ncbi:MAG TPA: two-component regulator propeller domain-containing protein, partial [Flavipsychrobacter sp.]|nr:two-component regulator propeller domain-containing protein [Flavipsychrobacter sp.]